jgi:hypothetical protein
MPIRPIRSTVERALDRDPLRGDVASAAWLPSPTHPRRRPPPRVPFLPPVTQLSGSMRDQHVDALRSIALSCSPLHTIPRHSGRYLLTVRRSAVVRKNSSYRAGLTPATSMPSPRYWSRSVVETSATFALTTDGLCVRVRQITQFKRLLAQMRPNFGSRIAADVPTLFTPAASRANEAVSHSRRPIE